MTFGEKQLQKHFNEGGDSYPTNMSIPKKSVKSGKQYFHLEFNQNKECLWIKTKVPYFKRRIYHSNILDNICRGLVSDSFLEDV